MNKIIEVNAARLAGLQIDLLQKMQQGDINDNHLEWFVQLNPDVREALMKGEYELKPLVHADDDMVITVDRTIKPSYPNEVEEVMYPELESTGPAQFNVRTLKLWQYEENATAGTVILQYLKSNSMLEDCLGLRDLEEIKKKGNNFFKRHFRGKAIFGCKSVARYLDGILYVPYLVDQGNKVTLEWGPLHDRWFAQCFAPRFA